MDNFGIYEVTGNARKFRRTAATEFEARTARFRISQETGREIVIRDYATGTDLPMIG